MRTAVVPARITREASAVRLSSNGVIGNWTPAVQHYGAIVRKRHLPATALPLYDSPQHQGCRPTSRGAKVPSRRSCATFRSPTYPSRVPS